MYEKLILVIFPVVSEMDWLVMVFCLFVCDRVYSVKRVGKKNTFLNCEVFVGI